jgi:hypothetical protein
VAIDEAQDGAHGDELVLLDAGGAALLEVQHEGADEPGGGLCGARAPDTRLHRPPAADVPRLAGVRAQDRELGYFVTEAEAVTAILRAF